MNAPAFKFIGKFRIIQLLGEGGMGEVYLAQDPDLLRNVAIKILHPYFARQANFQERFLQEARTAAMMDHPGIVKVYESGQFDSQLYIVMEFIRGDNLRQLLESQKKKGKMMPLKEALILVNLVCQAVDYTHGMGVLHRDIKPDNIMLKPCEGKDFPYQPVLTDLGLAKLVEGGVITTTGVVLGTPAYMAPEQLLGDPTDERADVYSLGVLLYELVLGRLPIAVKTISEAVRYHLKESLPLPRSIQPEIPEEVEGVILKALEKDPGKRFGRVREMEIALEKVTKGSSTLDAGSIGTVVAKESLDTEYQTSVLGQRVPSLVQEYVITHNVLRNTIQVISGNKIIKSMPMKIEGLTVGRENDNDIPIHDAKISPRHILIQFDGINYYITDQKSSSGSFLENNRLLPGVSEIWPPRKALRIGDTLLKLEQAPLRGDIHTDTILTRNKYSHIDAADIYTSGGEGRVGVLMDSTQITVEPGQSATLTITLINQGDLVDKFNLSIFGVPESWIVSKPQSVQLMPGDRQNVSLVIQPPRDSQSKAGQYQLTLKVTSQADPTQIAEASKTLTISAFNQYFSELHPQKIQVGQAGRITIKNQGNSQETFKLSWEDRADELNFKSTHTQLDIPEGQEAVAEFQAVPLKRRWIGRTEKSHPFNAQVTSFGGAPPQILSGEVISRGLLPPWILAVWIPFCLVCIVIGLPPFNHPIPTNTPILTSTLPIISQPTDTSEAILPIIPQPTDTSEAFQTRTSAKVEAIYLNVPPNIDGDLADWSQSFYDAKNVVFGADNWDNETDLSAKFMVGWDNQYLYIGADVNDDVYVQNSHGSDIYKGDSLDVLFDSNLAGDFNDNSLSADDYQIGISPGSPAPGDNPEAYLWFPRAMKGTLPNIKIGAQKRNGGYVVEVAIPWSDLGITPLAGSHYGFTFSVSDNDNQHQAVQQSMVSNVPVRHLTDPTTWGDLVLISP